jgi:protocatechuate 3,4-dioxygenase beta subunit
MNGKLLAGLLLVVLLGLGALYVVLSGGDSGRARDAGEGPATARTQDPAGPDGDLAAPRAPTAATEAAPRARVAGAAAPESRNTQGFDPATAWVDVEVVLPAGVPLEDELTLLAFSNKTGEDIEEWSIRSISSEIDLTDGYEEQLGDHEVAWARREVLGPGVVRIPLHPEAESGFVMLQSRYVFAEPLEVDAGEMARLEGALGAYVTGRVVIPAGARDRTFEPDDFELRFEGRNRDGFAFGGMNDGREVELEEDLTFEVRALSAERKYFVHAEADGLVDFLEMSFQADAGEHVTLDVVLGLGGTISGRVLDDDGAPVVGAHVEAEGTSGALMFMGGNEEGARSDADGFYQLRGVATGQVTISAFCDDFVDMEEATLEIAPGQVIEGYDILLSRGNTIRGRVEWPDGSPAAGASVGAYERRRQGWMDDVAGATSEEDGSFQLFALEEGPYEVRATLEPPGAEEEPPEVESGEKAMLEDLGYIDALGYGGNTSSASAWFGAVKGVRPETEGVVITLEAPLDFSGRVVDDTGASVTSFDVTARAAGGAGWGPRDEVSQDFESEDGTFTLSGVFPGNWLVRATASGFSSPDDELPVTVPHGGPPLELRLDRAASVEGQVVDPAGNPVADAEVVPAGDDPMMSFWDNETYADTDENGRFQIEDCKPAGLSLVASAEGWADSEPVPVEVAPGGKATGVVIALRAGGRITGEVYDSEGNPDAGATVSVGRQSAFVGLGGEMTARADAGGRFTFEGVTPGTVTVTAMPSEEELFESMAESDGEEAAMMNIFGQVRMESVEIGEGEEVHVVLGSEPKEPVRVVGTVTEAGAPLADVAVVAFQEGGAIVQGMKMANTDADGHYSLTVDRPGDFIFSVSRDGFGTGQVQFFVDVPEVEEHELPLEMPMGRITGTVLTPEGDPATGIPVNVSEMGGVLGMADLDQSRHFYTSDDGSFAFEHLEPGSYVVNAGGHGGFFSDESLHYGAVVVEDIELTKDASVDGLEIRLATAGKLRGTVRDESGKPVPGAAIFVRDRDGRVLSNISPCTTNGAGEFTYGGLPTGAVSVFARAGDRASTDHGPFEISEGGETEVELEVAPGCYLLVTLLDGEELVRARVQVLDEAGNQVNGLLSAEYLQNLVAEGFSSKERRVGPVSPGKYTLHAVSPDGKETKKTVRVRAGQEERKVKLRLK